MTTPTTGTVATVGGTSGMAPFPVHWYADIEGGGSTWATGSGEWPEGRWELQVIDNGTGEVYSPSLSRNAMTVTCPTNGHTASALNRFGAVGYAGAVIWDAGSYKCRLRYQNRDGDWSAWADSSTITVSADTRTTYYVDGTSGSDANDGTSWAQAKLTMNGALGLVSANNTKVVLKDDTSIAASSNTDLSAYSGIYITRSFDGAAAPTVPCNSSPYRLVTMGSDMVIDGFTLEYDTVTPLYGFDAPSSVAVSNIAVLNVDWENAGSFIELSDASDVDGILVYGGEQLAKMSRYAFFSQCADHVAILGVDWRLGSETESCVRIGPDVSGNERSWLTIDFSRISYANDDTSKDVLRVYVHRFFGTYRTEYADGVFTVGFPSSTQQGLFSDYRIDCCRWVCDNSGTTYTKRIFIGEGLKNCIFASFGVYRKDDNLGYVFQGVGTGYWDSAFDKIHVKNCTVHASRYAGKPQSNFIFELNGSSATYPIEEWKLVGNIFSTVDVATDYYRTMIAIDNPPDADSEITQNVWWINQTQLVRLVSDGVNGAITEASHINSLLSFASGNVDGNLTPDKDTMAISGGTAHQGIVTDITGVFESLTAGTGYTTEIDRTLSAWDAGAVQRDAMLVAEPVDENPSGNGTWAFWW